MQTIAVLEISEIEVLRKIAAMKPALEKLIEALCPDAKRKENAWTTSTDFRKSNDDMSNSTFWRRVKNGRIEINPETANNKLKLFRWNEGREQEFLQKKIEKKQSLRR